MINLSHIILNWTTVLTIPDRTMFAHSVNTIIDASTHAKAYYVRHFIPFIPDLMILWNVLLWNVVRYECVGIWWKKMKINDVVSASWNENCYSTQPNGIKSTGMLKPKENKLSFKTDISLRRCLRARCTFLNWKRARNFDTDISRKHLHFHQLEMAAMSSILTPCELSSVVKV